MSKVTIDLEIHQNELSKLFADLLFECGNHGKVEALIAAYQPLADLCMRVVQMPAIIDAEREAVRAGDTETASNIRDEIDVLLDAMVENVLCQRWQEWADKKEKDWVEEIRNA